MNYEKFPWGKYKGHKISSIESTYIVYALESFDLPIELHEALINELQKRFSIGVDEYNEITPIRVGTIYRELSKQFHPDAGGSDSAMQAINRFREMLLK